MKQLYRVEITVMVMAELPYEAKQIAVRNCQIDDADTYKATSTPSRWYDSIPYGSDDNATVGEILQCCRHHRQPGKERVGRRGEQP